MTQKAASCGNKGPWFQGLLASMKDPLLKVMEDDQVVVIKDKYPKAQHHFLVISKEDIPKIRNVEKKHERLLAHMENVGKTIAAEHKTHDFIFGYHSIPSMYRLHLHVISTDFDSPCLKTKQHWNSFTTPFFLYSEDVRKQLEEHQKIQFLSDEEYTSFLQQSLRCHKCSFCPKNMPELKRHILTHK